MGVCGWMKKGFEEEVGVVDAEVDALNRIGIGE